VDIYVGCLSVGRPAAEVFKRCGTRLGQRGGRRWRSSG